MIVTVYQSQWMTFVEHDAIRTDPTRMAQGIMTGIGFLGAGVIFKEGLTVRGLTTAASIWVTAAIGILVGNWILVCCHCRYGSRPHRAGAVSLY
jgi:putative Mg2+ transporter-C (MgtC) family protein